MNFRKDRRSMLEKEIDDVLEKMKTMDKTSKEYILLVGHLKILYEAQKSVKEPRKHISPDTWLLVAANLAGIILILKFEKFDSITSKAVQFIVKGRV